jgi:AcrR family transcriptional regulator
MANIDSAESTGDARPAKAAGRDADTGRRRRESPPGLSRERIVDTALGLVDREGLPALTFRRLGAALDCEGMSIYHYFPSKQHLVDALVEKTLEGVRDPPADLDPIARLRFLGYEYRAMAHRHPKFFSAAAAHRFNMPAGVAFIERMLGHFRATLPDDQLAAQMFRIFGYYVVGAALDETSGYAAGPSAAEAPWFQSTFDVGFEMLLKGIDAARATLPSVAAPAPKPVVRPKATGVDA